MAKSKLQTEVIVWVDASKALPDCDTEVLICFQRCDCDETAVTIGIYDDSDPRMPWEVDGGLTCFGPVLHWAELPDGPQR